MVVLYDRPWNPATEEQAIGRAHRRGQTRSVTVYRLMCRGTIEERVNVILSFKNKSREEVMRVLSAPPHSENSDIVGTAGVQS